MEQLILQPNSLVFYVDDTGDERFASAAHPMFAFGGVACVTEHHIDMAGSWHAMKAAQFPQLKGRPLHAKTHLRDNRAGPRKKAAVLDAMPPDRIGRFASVLTARTDIPLDYVAQTALKTLAIRCSEVADGFVRCGLWQSPGPVVAIFEQSARLAGHIQQHFDDRLRVGGHLIEIEGCFMPKSVANPFLEMADVVVNAVGKNIRHQLQYGLASCTSDFQTLFRDVGPPMAHYIEVTEVLFPALAQGMPVA
jgi:hypothetical protein